MENCCQSIIKYLIFILNFVIAVAGLALVGVSAYVYTQSEDNSSISLIVIGIITFIISFFGCYGSISENKCIIYTYATVLYVISLIEIFIAVSIYDYIPGLPKRLMSDMDNYGKNKTFTDGWSFMQKTLNCCGVMNYTDWNINSMAPGSDLNEYEDWNINSTALGSDLNEYADWNINSTAPGFPLNVINWNINSTAPGFPLNVINWNINSTAPGFPLNVINWNINSTAPGFPLNVINWNINSTALDSHLNVINYDDWNTNSTNIPKSCCNNPPCTATNVYTDGCFEKLATVLTMAATVAIGIALLQMIICMCSCWIGRGSRTEEVSRRQI